MSTSRRLLSADPAQTAFGLFVAGLVAWLIVLYWAAPFILNVQRHRTVRNPLVRNNRQLLRLK